ncbi:MAG: outer membrane protein assembly factor [Bacteroidales bacterium]|nr:outer membrane protein assembly factor [Bacteroidales bacterium]
MKRTKKTHALGIVAALILVLMPTISQAQEAENDSLRHNALDKVIDFAETVLDVLTIDHSSWSLAIYPAASYSGRQGLALGIMPMLQLRNPNLPRPTTITPSALISTKGMWELQCDADIYLKNGQTILAKAEFYRQPDDYFGIESIHNGETIAKYKYRRFLFTADYLKKIGTTVQIGISTDFTYHSFTSIENCSDTIAQEIGLAEKWTNGLGIVAGIDTRDNVLNPRCGWYANMKVMSYGGFIGSRHDFILATIDARRYIAIGKQSVMALQAYVSTATGRETPFHKMPGIGGTRLGRAIPHNLKHVDRNAWLIQAEFRFPVYWRIGATTWAGAGSVSHDINRDLINNSCGMFGCGLRFKVFPEHGLNLRLDAGLTTNGDHAIYFNIREAF